MTKTTEEIVELYDKDWDKRTAGNMEFSRKKWYSEQEMQNLKPSDNIHLKKVCPNGCTYSRTMNQKYPRKCLVCGNIEGKP